jgi:hypothetical protein
MKALPFFAMLFLATSPFVSRVVAEEPADDRCFELRVYYAAEGKLDALNARFRSHTLKLFEKHGMTNVGYWTPVENPDRLLYYVLAFPSREARDASWRAFGSDPEWKAVAAATEKDGRLVTKVDSTLMHATDYSPGVEPSHKPETRVFELRTYTATPGNLDRLHARFRDHTCELFEKHGMTNIGYWSLDDDQPNAGETLVYLLAHESQNSRDASFDAFRSDPDWVAARDASEKAAGGSLTAPDGVQSVMLEPTDYSPTR